MTEETHFAPAEKAKTEILEDQVHSIAENPALRKILDAVPEAVLILNQHRQVIFVNTSARSMIPDEQLNTILGLRVGDILHCENAELTPGGCGTTESCAFCGAVNAMLASQKGKNVIEEVRISLESGDSIDLRVKASPYMDGDDLYTVFSIADISDEKRKQILERTFFHDILNTASGLSGYSELLLEANQEEVDEYKNTIYRLTRNIIDEINAQKMLIDAENGQLDTMPTECNSLSIWKTIVDFYSKSAVAIEKSIDIDPASESVDFVIDVTLLSRVLGNMLKNALEASGPGTSVTVSCRRMAEQIQFSVNSRKVMPREVQMQVFKRSFSTKGKGRGIGTYSMKMLSEKYLNGSVSFDSNEIDGTTFTASYPIKPAQLS